MVILDATIVNVALPSVARELGGGVTALQRVADAYTLAFGGLLLTAGTLGDRFGAKRAFDAGLALFTAASAACAVAPGTGALIAARALQGLGAALLVPNSLALVRASYADPTARARAVGAWGAIAGIAAASGPILGGVLVALRPRLGAGTSEVPDDRLLLLSPPARGERSASQRSDVRPRA